MKNICRYAGVFVVIGVALSITTGFATGTVSSKVIDGVAYVYHINANWNCCPDTVMEIIPNADSADIIDIFEHDLGTHPCGCMCYFDFTHKLEGLAPGNYTARVWEVFWDNEPLLAGTTTFTIPVQTGSLVFSSGMSNCHDEPGGIGEDTPLQTMTSLESVSPFASQSVEISFTTEAKSQIILAIYNSAGIKVRDLYGGVQDAGMHVARWDACDDDGNKVPRGTYFVILRSENNMHSLPLIVLR
jgi:hypothetical protein